MKEKSLAWKHYTRPLERRLQHLEAKENQNSFDKHEASALRHVLGVVTQPQRTWVGLTDEDKKEYVAQDFGGNRLDAMDWAEKRLKEKNT